MSLPLVFIAATRPAFVRLPWCYIVTETTALFPQCGKELRAVTEIVQQRAGAVFLRTPCNLP